MCKKNTLFNTYNCHLPIISYEVVSTIYLPQLAALDFIVCAASDAFAMTDSGSQLSSLVSGYRIYFGGGKMPTIRPNKRRLAAIFMKNSTIEWRVFEQRMRKAVRQTKHIMTRPVARSVYRYPRCKECMCNNDSFADF